MVPLLEPDGIVPEDDGEDAPGMVVGADAPALLPLMPDEDDPEVSGLTLLDDELPGPVLEDDAPELSGEGLLGGIGALDGSLAVDPAVPDCPDARGIVLSGDAPCMRSASDDDVAPLVPEAPAVPLVLLPEVPDAPDDASLLMPFGPTAPAVPLGTLPVGPVAEPEGAVAPGAALAPEEEAGSVEEPAPEEVP